MQKTKGKGGGKETVLKTEEGGSNGGSKPSTNATNTKKTQQKKAVQIPVHPPPGALSLLLPDRNPKSSRGANTNSPSPSPTNNNGAGGRRGSLYKKVTTLKSSQSGFQRSQQLHNPNLMDTHGSASSPRSPKDPFQDTASSFPSIERPVRKNNYVEVPPQFRKSPGLLKLFRERGKLATNSEYQAVLREETAQRQREEAAARDRAQLAAVREMRMSGGVSAVAAAAAAAAASSAASGFQRKRSDPLLGGLEYVTNFLAKAREKEKDNAQEKEKTASMEKEREKLRDRDERGERERTAQHFPAHSNFTAPADSNNSDVERDTPLLVCASGVIERLCSLHKEGPPVHVFEIGSGTGGLLFSLATLFPHVRFQPTEANRGLFPFIDHKVRQLAAPFKPATPLTNLSLSLLDNKGRTGNGQGVGDGMGMGGGRGDKRGGGRMGRGGLGVGEGTFRSSLSRTQSANKRLSNDEPPVHHEELSRGFSSARNRQGGRETGRERSTSRRRGQRQQTEVPGDAQSTNGRTGIDSSHRAHSIAASGPGSEAQLTGGPPSRAVTIDAMTVDGESIGDAPLFPINVCCAESERGDATGRLLAKSLAACGGKTGGGVGGSPEDDDSPEAYAERQRRRQKMIKELTERINAREREKRRAEEAKRAKAKKRASSNQTMEKAEQDQSDPSPSSLNLSLLPSDSHTDSQRDHPTSPESPKTATHQRTNLATRLGALRSHEPPRSAALRMLTRLRRPPESVRRNSLEDLGERAEEGRRSRRRGRRRPLPLLGEQDGYRVRRTERCCLRMFKEFVDVRKEEEGEAEKMRGRRCTREAESDDDEGGVTGGPDEYDCLCVSDSEEMLIRNLQDDTLAHKYGLSMGCAGGLSGMGKDNKGSLTEEGSTAAFMFGATLQFFREELARVAERERGMAVLDPLGRQSVSPGNVELPTRAYHLPSMVAGPFYRGTGSAGGGVCSVSLVSGVPGGKPPRSREREKDTGLSALYDDAYRRHLHGWRFAYTHGGPHHLLALPPWSLNSPHNQVNQQTTPTQNKPHPHTVVLPSPINIGSFEESPKHKGHQGEMSPQRAAGQSLSPRSVHPHSADAPTATSRSPPSLRQSPDRTPRQKNISSSLSASKGKERETSPRRRRKSVRVSSSVSPRGSPSLRSPNRKGSIKDLLSGPTSSSSPEKERLQQSAQQRRMSTQLQAAGEGGANNASARGKEKDKSAEPQVANLLAPKHLDVLMPLKYWPIMSTLNWRLCLISDVLYLLPRSGVRQLFEGAASILRRDGYIILSERLFFRAFCTDKTLRLDAALSSFRKDEWCVKEFMEVKQIAQQAGFAIEGAEQLPDDRYIITFRKL